MTIRCFIAIELDQDIRGELAQLQKHLRKKLPGNESSITWVNPDHIHLTLKFLGEVADPLVPEICAAVSAAAAQCAPFDIEIGNLGCFPPHRPARVLWVGIRNGQDDLAALAEAVDIYLSELDFPPENRKFSAHLTLARIKHENAGRATRNVVEKTDPFTFGSQSVTALTLFQSQLTPRGSIYTPLHYASLTSD